MRFKKRKLWLVILIFIVLIGCVVTTVALLTQYRRCEDVDIKSGRIRYTRYFLNYKISEKIEDSILTETIGQFTEDVQPDWQRVNRFDGIIDSISPHYKYHGAIGQIHSVDKIWQLYPFSDEVKKHLAQTILDKWQSDGYYFGVNRYLMNVSSMADQKTKSDPKAIISVADLSSIQNEQEILSPIRDPKNGGWQPQS